MRKRFTQLAMFEEEKPAVVMGPESLLVYDWIVLSSSGGKDSLAMISYVCELAAKLDILHKVIIVHANLGVIIRRLMFQHWPYAYPTAF